MAEEISVVEKFFPLRTVLEVVQLFQYELETTKEPNLALLSIVVGSIENLLTCNRPLVLTGDDEVLFSNIRLPTIDYNIIYALYTKFCSTIRGFVDLSSFGNIKYATRPLVKRVSDVIWNSLTRSYYKDRAHLQSLYSYLTGNKLDCFGVAFAVVAGCQVLGFNDVHLALSEDHAWVVFGENSNETAEVTWHGKGNEDKRGQSADAGIASKCWLYLNGFPVKCSRQMEVAALVSAINPSMNANTDAVEVTVLQQKLLWMLYDLGHLALYPMALGNLGDLEEINPTISRSSCSLLFEEAILSARANYSNMHVYPYTYQGGYFYRQKMYKEAFESWANAADVLKQYNYTRDDGEIYKEVMEIANELIPHIMKVVSGHSATSVLKDPECFAYLLKFYDGICLWEEGSQTPVLHIGWTRPLVTTISKFDSDVRGRVSILQQEISDDGDENCNNVIAETKHKFDKNSSCENGFWNDDQNQNKVVDEEAKSNLHPGIEELTAACGQKLLNRDFLIQGGGEPFIGDGEIVDVCPILNEESENTFETLLSPAYPPQITLFSEKMKGLKNLLLGEKLNTQAITLQLTAQSQVQVGKKSSLRDMSDTGFASRVKRSRRE